MTTTLDALAPLHADMRHWRRDIHAHPELGFQESRTAGLVADKLAALGLQVTRGVGKTGVVGTLRAGTSARARSAFAPTWTRCRSPRPTPSSTARATPA